MKLVALTGGIGSGKSTALKIFAQLGVPCLSLDDIAHTLCAPSGLAIKAIEETFGPEVITSDRALNRPKMRSLVFSNPHAKSQLEEILHPLIHRISLEKLHVLASNTPYAIVEIPLLFESSFWFDKVDRVLLIDLPENLQIERTCARSQLSQEEIRRIIHAQAPREKRIQGADDIVCNLYDLNTLTERIKALHKIYHFL